MLCLFGYNFLLFFVQIFISFFTFFKCRVVIWTVISAVWRKFYAFFFIDFMSYWRQILFCLTYSCCKFSRRNLICTIMWKAWIFYGWLFENFQDKNGGCLSCCNFLLPRWFSRSSRTWYKSLMLWCCGRRKKNVCMV